MGGINYLSTINILERINRAEKLRRTMHFRRLHYNTMACKEFCAEGGIVSIKVYDHLSQNNIADLFYHIWLPHIVHHISKIMHEKICSTDS